MTVVLTVTCDKCSERIAAARTLLRVESGPLRDRLQTVDLCAGCQAALLGWLRHAASATGSACAEATATT